jgi:hypothetical protein
MRLIAVCLLLGLTACSSLQPAEPLTAGERHVCRPGSALKYRQPANTGWPGQWVPTRPGENCKSR